jgi:hypothetical protein
MKIHALTDVVGRSYALMLTPGNVKTGAIPVILEHSNRIKAFDTTNSDSATATSSRMLTAA